VVTLIRGLAPAVIILRRFAAEIAHNQHFAANSFYYRALSFQKRDTSSEGLHYYYVKRAAGNADKTVELRLCGDNYETP
jgi:hypothetical protein